jgi:hypothetical protein
VTYAEPVLLRAAYQDWYCPNCGTTDQTLAMPPDSSQYHPCPGLHGLNAPLVRAGVKAKVEALERQDYLCKDTQTTGDNGVVYMAIHTERDDGDDLVVHAPVARMRVT